MEHVPQLRAAGCLHDTFETLNLVWLHGGADGMFNFFNAMLAGRVDQGIIDLLGDLRAVIFYKDGDKTKLRPIGIGESLRRLICRCVAHQDCELWDAFFTHMLPEDAAARDFAIAEATGKVESAQLRAASAVQHGYSDAYDEAQAALVEAQSELAAAPGASELPGELLLRAQRHRDDVPLGAG